MERVDLEIDMARTVDLAVRLLPDQLLLQICDEQGAANELSGFFQQYSEYIPITFLLGFYVSCVFNRWSEVFNNLGWVDTPSLLITTYIKGTDEMARRTRRTLIRYLVLTQAMVFRDVSTCVKKRFPTMDHLVTAGIMTENELREFDAIKSPHIKYWLPMEWAFALCRKARDVKMIESDYIYVDLLEKFRQYRVQVLQLTLYDWVPIPLVYTQVVHIAVRTYFLIALIGRQYLLNNDTIDLFIPVMTIFQFLFFIGWMKVAEVLLNPLGEDDDDFETNWVLDRNLQVGLSIVDDCYGKVPALERDVFWEDMVPQPLYTAESAARPHNPMIGSCNDLISVTEDALLVKPRRRLMSTVAMVPDPQESKDQEVDEDGEPVIPVRQHNPMRRSMRLSVSNNGAKVENATKKVLGSIKRKFTKKVSPSTKRRSSATLSNFGDWYERGPVPRFAISKPEGHTSRNGSLGNSFHNTHNGNISSRQSSCSSIMYDGLHSPFSQSLSHNAFNQAVNRMSESSDTMTFDAKKEDESEAPAERLGQSGAWTVNEMLPVIHEEREKSRNSSNSADSIYSDSNQNTLRNEAEIRSGLPILEPIDEECRSIGRSSQNPESPNNLNLDAKFSQSLPQKIKEEMIKIRQASTDDKKEKDQKNDSDSESIQTDVEVVESESVGVASTEQLHVDEQNSENKTEKQNENQCETGYFDCGSPNSTYCIPFTAVRDCVVDCENGSDEMCGDGLHLCDTNVKQSNSRCGKCVRNSELGKFCIDHKWENLCKEENVVKCLTNDNCVHNTWINDGVNDCGDGSDENCPGPQCPVTGFKNYYSSTMKTPQRYENIKKNVSYAADCGDNLLGNPSLTGISVRSVYDTRCHDPLNCPFTVLCDFDLFGGGWTILFQRKFPPQIHFNRTWIEYKNGFGVMSANTEFWVGNDQLHSLTSRPSCNNEMIVVAKTSREGVVKYTKYNSIHVCDETEGYKLQLGILSGAVPYFENIDGFLLSRDKPFQTFDSKKRQCPQASGGWWMRNDECNMEIPTTSFYAYQNNKGVIWNRERIIELSLLIRPRGFTAPLKNE
ncbi:unnamed protein product [Bursaphelenchus okinawaensis]|uniref:Fibrinogen C-terminal domain-containing protein n=1 Tax=Bursaphelenchus okinawaensis TaxID=465554 RepID=A0A811K6G3_9BILA|nr:unnamed protein product [Bursaphelenchus okinawaensis]CAG9092406.1 unnamed protein product [Bursaphelenchus okinawaensis]